MPFNLSLLSMLCLHGYKGPQCLTFRLNILLANLGNPSLDKNMGITINLTFTCSSLSHHGVNTRYWGGIMIVHSVLCILFSRAGPNIHHGRDEWQHSYGLPVRPGVWWRPNRARYIRLSFVFGWCWWDGGFWNPPWELLAWYRNVFWGADYSVLAKDSQHASFTSRYHFTQYCTRRWERFTHPSITWISKVSY